MLRILPSVCASAILLVIAGVAGYFSLPKSDVVIERIWEAVA